MPKEAYKLLKEGKISKKQYWKEWLKENGYVNDIEYRNEKSREKGYESYLDELNKKAIIQGYKSFADKQDKKAKEKGHKNHFDKIAKEHGFFGEAEYIKYLRTINHHNKDKQLEKERTYRYRHTTKGKIAIKRRKTKRYRELGYIPLNEWEFSNEEFEGHHLDLEHVLYIPIELHTSVRHNVFTDRNINKINELAMNWYTEYYGLI